MHRFDRETAGKDPYVVSAQQVESHAFPGEFRRGAQEQAFDALSNAIVTALGDIAAQAYRLGINDPKQMRGLSRAVASSCDAVFLAYGGEIDPEPALQAIGQGPRVAALSEEQQDKLRREVEKTRQLETLVLTARRIPDLVDFAGSLGLRIPEEDLQRGTLLVGEHPTPTADIPPTPDGGASSGPSPE